MHNQLLLYSSSTYCSMYYAPPPPRIFPHFSHGEESCGETRARLGGVEPRLGGKEGKSSNDSRLSPTFWPVQISKFQNPTNSRTCRPARCSAPLTAAPGSSRGRFFPHTACRSLTTCEMRRAPVSPFRRSRMGHLNVGRRYYPLIRDYTRTLLGAIHMTLQFTPGVRSTGT